MKHAKNEARMSVEARLTVVENSIQSINTVLIDIKQEMKDFKQEMKRCFDKIDNRFEAMDRKFDLRCDRLENRLWSNFLWLMSMIIGVAGLIAHTQHWI